MRRWYEDKKRTGKFVVVDGIDGVGKGVFLDTFVEEAKKDQKKVFDVNEFWKHYEINPKLNSIIGKYDVVLTSEPTFMGTGKLIRDELIAMGKNYPVELVALAYSLDRRVLYGELVLPLLSAGVDVYQSRSFASSLVYQRQTALNQNKPGFTMGQILSIPGNEFCSQHPMDHLVVPTIRNVEEAVRRSQFRDKQDNCVFENLEFQLKARELYESRDFRRLFKGLNVPLTYMDAGVSIEFSKEQAREFYEKCLR
jgi:thymidylate kinase